MDGVGELGDVAVGGPWFRTYRPAPDRPIRLVCFPHAGGSAVTYLNLATVVDAVDVRAEVVAVQYPGRQDRMRERPATDLGRLADDVTEALVARFAGPVALFGHSMGAAVAFEVTRRLERLGREPVRLFASGCRAPSLERDEGVHELDDDGLIAKVSRLGGTSPQLLADKDIMALALPAIRADYTAIETYRAADDTRVSCPITALTGDDDPNAPLDQVRAWARHTSAEFEMLAFPGGHFYLVDQWSTIADQISKGLAG